MNYVHTQRAPIWLIPLTLGAAAMAAVWWLRGQGTLALAVGGLGAAFILLSLCFKTLTVADEGDAVAIRYGPLPLFRKRIPFAAITHVEPSHSAVIDGWGIHFIPGRGWTYNLWGRQCVQLTANGKTMRIGSEDAVNLAQIIRAKIAA